MRSRTFLFGVLTAALAMLVIGGAVFIRGRQSPPIPTAASEAVSRIAPTTTESRKDVPVATPAEPSTEPTPAALPTAVPAEPRRHTGLTSPNSSAAGDTITKDTRRSVPADATPGGETPAPSSTVLGAATPPKSGAHNAAAVATVASGTVVTSSALTPAKTPETSEPPPRPSQAPATQPDRPPSPAPPTTTPTSARVWIVAEPADTVVGGALVLHVFIDGVTDAASVPFHVIFNPAVVRFERGDEGSFLSAGAQTAFFASPTSTGDRVVVGLSRLGDTPGVSGSGELCRLQFTAIGAGDSGLAFDRAKVRGANNKILPASFAPTRVLVR